jgi:hypothetical protein
MGNASEDSLYTIESNKLWRENLGVLGLNVGFFIQTRKELARPAAQAVIAAFADGLLTVPIDLLPP